MRAMLSLERRARTLVPIALIAGALHSAPARASDPAVDAAARANEVNQVYCGDAWSRDITLAAESLTRVIDAWSKVDEVYTETEDNYLLFWRGVLAQCLNRPEDALDDLTTFVDREDEDGAYEDLVRQAKRRLRRLGETKDLGQGPLAEHLQASPTLEVMFGYQGGLVGHFMACSDDAGEWLNQACIGPKTTWKNAPLGLPVGGDLGLAVYPAKNIGIAARGTLAVTTQSTIGPSKNTSGEINYEDTSVGPTWTALIGPQLRFQRAMSTGSRGLRFRILPGFHVRHVRLSPFAGNLVGSKTQELLIAGTYGWTRPGIAGWADLSMELSKTLGLRIAFTGGFSFPETDPRLAVVEEPYHSVRIYPDPVKLTATHGGGQVGLVIVRKNTSVAFTPTLVVLWEGSQLVYPNRNGNSDDDTDNGDTWTVPASTNDETRKVYSTHQSMLSVMLQVGVQFGAGARK